MLLPFLFLLNISTNAVFANNFVGNTRTSSYPPYLSFHQYKSILSFENEKIFNENDQQIDESTFDMYMNWNTVMNDAKETYGKANTSISSLSSTSPFSSGKNNIQQMLPYVVCHLDDSSLSGSERYEILQSSFAKLYDSASSDFIIDKLPIYNHNVDQRNTELKEEKEIEKEKKDTVSGACYYSSLHPSLAKQITEKNIFVTPLLSFLKLRRVNFRSNEKDIIDTTTRAVSVHLSPGHASSQDTVMEYAYGLLQVISKELSTDITTSSCNVDMIKTFSSASVTVSSNDASVFYYEIVTSSQNNIITHGCYKAFTKYLANQHETVSVELIAKTVLHNDIVRWIVESSVENSKPWSDIGLNGENQILQVSDSGLDETHCYFTDATGVVPLTTNFDLTGGKIDTTKRKVINYVALSGIGDRTDYSKHGSHVVGSILGKRSDDGVNEVPGLIDGVASASKVTFFDANDNEEDDMKFLIPLDISQMFYFGKQSQAFGHSASWGSNSNGGQYSSRSKEIDQYFYESEEDNFIMFLAAGNDGTVSGAKIDDPCQSKNVICVGASNSAGDNLKTGMLDMNYIAFFSSPGPTADNRIKPDLIAPGFSVLSVNANSGLCDPSSRPQYEENKQESAGTIFLSGTSMACPIVAGSAALVRQYFQEKHDPPMDISGTLLKAVLINGAQALIGRSVAATGSSNDASSPYDGFQGFGKINLLKSLKHPDDSYDSPDIHVEDERVLRQGQVHEYEFDVCDAHEFRVTIVWRDPPNGSEGCSKCLVNDLDMEVELNGQIYYPNGSSGKDDRNNVERVVLNEDDFTSSSSNTVIVKVRAANLGFGSLQKYSLSSTGCINDVEFITTTPSPTTLCISDQFELKLEVFTDRKPEELSWLLEYQGSGGVIDSGIAGGYDKRLHRYDVKNCVKFGCFLFIIKDTAFDGLCCAKGMGTYSVSAGDNEILVDGNAFYDRQEIQKFCYYGLSTEEPTASPTILCNEDEFKYQIDINTDLNPDEIRWELREPRIDGIIPGTYTDTYTLYENEGCLDLDGCYFLYVYGREGEYSIRANDFVVTDRESFLYGETKEFCYSSESNTTTNYYGIRTEAVGGIDGEKFDDMHPLWQYGKIKEIEIYTDMFGFFYNIRVTYESGHSFSHGENVPSYVDHIVITLDENQYITKVSGRAYDHISQLTFQRNDGEIFGPYGCWPSRCEEDNFEFDFNGNALVYIFGRVSDQKINQLDSVTQLGFAHSSISSSTPSPTPQPCDAGKFQYQVSLRTDEYPEEIYWELYHADHIIDSVPFMTYRKQFETYSHTACARYDNCYVLVMYDKWRDGLCCYFGNGSYKLSVGNDVLIQGNHFDDAYSVGTKYYYKTHEFCLDLSDSTPSTAIQPSSKPSEFSCGEEEFEYRIRMRTDSNPGNIDWDFEYSNGDIIESVEYQGYFLQHYEYNHFGCIPLNECLLFVFNNAGSGSVGCCYFGNAGFTIFADDNVMAEGGKVGGEEYKEFCYGPSYSQSPSLEPSTSHPTSSIHPSSQPITVADICEHGSDYTYYCGYLASIGACEDGNSSRDWMLKKCKMACSNCCMDWKSDSCEYDASEDRCTDTTIYRFGFTWQDWMQGTCRVSCETCGIDFTPSPTPPVVCNDGEFKYEIDITTTDDDYYYYYSKWLFLYKYPDLIDGYEIPEKHKEDSFYEVYGIVDGDRGRFPPLYETKKYGCLKYSCFEFEAKNAYLKIFDVDRDTLIAENIEPQETKRFCNYAPTPQPTKSPVITLNVALFTITLTFSTTSLHKEEIVSTVSYRSIRKIIFHANTLDTESYNHQPFISVEYSSCEEFQCDVSFRICMGSDSCSNDEVLDPDILAFTVNMMNEAEANGLLFLTLKQTGHHMTAEIFDTLENDINIEYDFEYEAWPTTSPTASSLTLSSSPTQECNTPIIIQNLFGLISNIFHPIIQVVNNTLSNVTSSISDVFVGVDTYNSTDPDAIFICKDKMFQLQIEIITDGTPDRTSWELLYENGTVIHSVGRDTYSECDTSYKHNFCLDTSCFVFNMWDSFSFQGSYNITVGDTVLAQQQDSFHWWKDTKRFCYPVCDEDGMFAVHIDLVTDPWPQEISWDLSFDNGTFIDGVEERYYSGINTFYSHRYCLHDGCYDVTFHDYIGDGMCCSYGEGSYEIKIDDDGDDYLILGGGEFGYSHMESFCHISTETSDEEEESTFLFGMIAGLLFNDDSCCNDMK